MTLKNTKENVTIFLENTQTSGSDSEKIEFASEGSFYQKDGKKYIVYKEHKEMGMGDSQVLLKIEPDTVTMRRMGEFQTVMMYKKGEITDFIYHTPFGELDMKIKTGEIEDALDEKGGILRFTYQLFSGGEAVDNEILLRVRIN